MTKDEMREIRVRIRSAVSDLHELDDALAELCESLPLPCDVAEMWESRIPTSFAGHLYATIEAVRRDCLQEGMTILLHAVRQSEASLRLDFWRDLESAGVKS